MTFLSLKNFSKKKVGYLLIILLLPSFFYLVLSKGDHYYQFLPYIGPKVVADNGDTLYHRIPNFTLTDHNGNAFGNEQLKGKVVVADFFFTRCPTICPKMAAHLLDLQKKFADRQDVIIISHTVDPKHDTVEVLKAYSKKVHAEDGRWFFLTGSRDDIYDLAMKGYFAPASEDEVAPGGFLHSNLIFLIDQKGRLRGTYDDAGVVQAAWDGTSTSEMKKMADAIDNLLLEEYVPKKD